MKFSPSKINQLIVSSLSPDLLIKKYEPTTACVKTAGHCYVASEAAYHLYAGDMGFRPYHMVYDGISHWFLGKPTVGLPPRKSRYMGSTIDDIDIIDLTFEQFTYQNNYANLWHSSISVKKVCRGFLTKEPSKRARVLMNRVIKKMNAR